MSTSRNNSATNDIFYPATVGATIGAGLGVCGGIATFLYLATHPEHHAGFILSALPLVAGWIPAGAIGAGIGATLFGAKKLCTPRELQADIESHHSNESQPLVNRA